MVQTPWPNYRRATYGPKTVFQLPTGGLQDELENVYCVVVCTPSSPRSSSDLHKETENQMTLILPLFLRLFLLLFLITIILPLQYCYPYFW